MDGSGKITALELSDWMKKHGRVMNPDGIKLMIDAFDENDDGQIGKDWKLVYFFNFETFAISRIKNTLLYQKSVLLSKNIFILKMSYFYQKY